MNVIEELYKKRLEIDAKIKTIQEECCHPESVVSAEHGSDRGNYDPSLDSSWTTFTCGLCGKQWTKDY